LWFEAHSTKAGSLATHRSQEEVERREEEEERTPPWSLGRERDPATTRIWDL
jgi:hypothetical protein